MGRHSRAGRRTPRQAAADRRAAEIAARLGRMLQDARRNAGLRQEDAASLAGFSQGTWSRLEAGGDGRVTMATWSRAAAAVGSDMDAHLRRASAASQPRDAVHLRHQELVMRTAASGGWHALPEQQLDAVAHASRAADVLLQRDLEYALVEIWDWFEDVGAALRSWDRRLAGLDRYAVARMGGEDLPRTAGLWVVRATQRNRHLVAEHRHVFRARFPVGGGAWIRAMTSAAGMPPAAGLVWVAVTGDRLFPARPTAANI